MAGARLRFRQPLGQVPSGSCPGTRICCYAKLRSHVGRTQGSISTEDKEGQALLRATTFPALPAKNGGHTLAKRLVVGRALVVDVVLACQASRKAATGVALVAEARPTARTVVGKVPCPVSLGALVGAVVAVRRSSAALVAIAAAH